jgi:hypothetical protein
MRRSRRMFLAKIMWHNHVNKLRKEQSYGHQEGIERYEEIIGKEECETRSSSERPKVVEEAMTSQMKNGGRGRPPFC